MRTIEREECPACLDRQPRGQDWRTFMGTACHAELQTQLQIEQRGLCCYCEMEIDELDSHIEHMEPRSANPARTYDYGNLVASCNGGVVEHCGHFKDDRHRNPTHRWDATRFCPPHDPATAPRFSYLPDGSVNPAAAADDSAAYMIGYLGLNCPRLSARRAGQARDIIDTLGNAPDPDLLAWMRSTYLDESPEGRLKAFPSLSRQLLT